MANQNASELGRIERARVSRSSNAPAREDGLIRRLLPKLIISMVLGLVFAWIASRGGVPIVPSRKALSHIEWWSVPVYVLSLLVAFFLRASRWRFLIAPIKKMDLREVIGLNWIGFFAIFLLPLRIGEIMRPALTKVRHGIPISVGLGTVAVERVVDGLVTSLCVAWALFALPRQPTEDPLAKHLPTYGYISLAVFAGAFAALGMFLWQRELAVRLIRKTFGLISPNLSEFLADKVSSVADGIHSMSSPTLTAGFLFETCLYWGINALGMWLLAIGCGISMKFEYAVATMGILALGVLLPSGPGLFGNFQLAVSAALKLYFDASILASEGAAWIFLMYVCQAVVISISGIIPLYLMNVPFLEILRVGTRKSSPAPAPPNAPNS